MRRVVILRGISGAGKTHRANTVYGHGVICSATDYYMKTGTYMWNPTEIEKAHEECMKKFLIAVTTAAPLVVVDNCHIHKEEFTPYALVAKSMGYHVKAERMVCSTAVAYDRNIHGVPLDKVTKMWRTMQDCPWWLKETQICGS